SNARECPPKEAAASGHLTSRLHTSRCDLGVPKAARLELVGLNPAGVPPDEIELSITRDQERAYKPPPRPCELSAVHANRRDCPHTDCLPVHRSVAPLPPLLDQTACFTDAPLRAARAAASPQ